MPYPVCGRTGNRGGSGLGLYHDFAQRVLEEAREREQAQQQAEAARKAEQDRFLADTRAWIADDILPVLREAGAAYSAIGAPVEIVETPATAGKPVSLSFILGEAAEAGRRGRRDRRVIVEILPIDAATLRLLSRSATGRVLDQSFTRETVGEGLQTHLFAALEDWVRLASSN